MVSPQSPFKNKSIKKLIPLLKRLFWITHDIKIWTLDTGKAEADVG